LTDSSMPAKMRSTHQSHGCSATHPPQVSFDKCLLCHGFLLMMTTAPNPDPLDQYSPVKHACSPEVAQNVDTIMPSLRPPSESATGGARDEFEYYATDLYEWLSLVRLQSPRVLAGDQIDPYLCRYQVPGDDKASLCKITWRGFLAPSWSRQTLIDIIASLPSKTWFSFSTTTFSKGVTAENSECTFLRPQGSPGEYVMWEVKSHE